MLQPIPAGFSRPVFESQGTFRAVLQAMSAPGRVVPMPVAAQGPRGWPGTMAALVLTLCDMDTPLWLDPAAASHEALRFVRFHCGSPQASEPHAAALAVILEPRDMPALHSFAPGTAEYPERSATVLVWSANLGHSGPGVQAPAIQGPGIDGRGELPLHWLPEGFAAQWRANAGLFPCGVDVILAGPGAVVGLPRTVTMEA